jgi:hypothetical protein
MTEKPTAATNFTQKTIQFLSRPEIQAQIQGRVLDPLLEHIMRRVYPYIILSCVLFSLLLLAVLIALGIIIFQVRSPVGVVSGLSFPLPA